MSDAAYGRIFGISIGGIFALILALSAIAQSAP
jgi:hypothetical protein